MAIFRVKRESAVHDNVKKSKKDRDGNALIIIINYNRIIIALC